MTIERTGKMKMHKGFLLRMLRERPEVWKELVHNHDDFPGGAVDLIAALESAPGVWMDSAADHPLTDEEWKERYGE